MTLTDQVASKRQELAMLKKINTLTESMKQQFDELAIQVAQMHDNAEGVAQVMKNWDSILKSISQASLSLLQYSEGDYEVGKWDTSNDNQEKEPPLPETLVRIRVNEDDQ